MSHRLYAAPTQIYILRWFLDTMVFLVLGVKEQTNVLSNSVYQGFIYCQVEL